MKKSNKIVLIANDVVLNAAGFSQIDIYAARSLDLSASGSSHISYFGHPKKVNRDVFGFAHVSEEQ